MKDVISVDTILAKLENEVARDISLRMTQHRSGRSPKSIHAESKTLLHSLLISKLPDTPENKAVLAEMFRSGDE